MWSPATRRVWKKHRPRRNSTLLITQHLSTPIRRRSSNRLSSELPRHHPLDDATHRLPRNPQHPTDRGPVRHLRQICPSTLRTAP